MPYSMHISEENYNQFVFLILIVNYLSKSLERPPAQGENAHQQIGVLNHVCVFHFR